MIETAKITTIPSMLPLGPPSQRPPLAGSNILVTGGAGFIGSHLVDELQRTGAGRVVVIDNLFCGKLENLAAALKNGAIFVSGDAENRDTLERLMVDHKISVVFNCATKALNHSFFNPADAFLTNAVVMSNLLELQRRGAFQSLLHLSSSEVYGTARREPMDEDHPLGPTTTYAAGKAAADLLLGSYVRMFGVDASIIRPFNNYGPRQNWEGQLAALIPITARRVIQGHPPIIHGSGNQERDYIFVLDTARLIVRLFGVLAPGETVNLCGGEKISVNVVVKQVLEGFDSRLEPVFEPARAADVLCHLGSCDRAREKFSFELTPFKQGLAQTLDWYARRWRSSP